jgi:hypothetical protein
VPPNAPAERIQAAGSAGRQVVPRGLRSAVRGKVVNRFPLCGRHIGVSGQIERRVEIRMGHAPFHRPMSQKMDQGIHSHCGHVGVGRQIEGSIEVGMRLPPSKPPKRRKCKSGL